MPTFKFIQAFASLEAEKQDFPRFLAMRKRIEEKRDDIIFLAKGKAVAQLRRPVKSFTVLRSFLVDVEGDMPPYLVFASHIIFSVTSLGEAVYKDPLHLTRELKL